MTTATMTTPQLELADTLLEQLLCGTPWDRLRAHGEILSAHLGGLTVNDAACHDTRRGPLAVTLGDLYHHLCRVDSQQAIAAREGRRIHTPDNVRFGDTDGTHGPALGAAR